MNEADTRVEHIDPALKAAGRGVIEGSRIRREYPPPQSSSQQISAAPFWGELLIVHFTLVG